MRRIKKIKVLFVGYGEPTASSRYRAEQYISPLNRDYSRDIVARFYGINSTGHSFVFLRMLARRLFSLLLAIKYDVIYLQKNPVKILSPYYEFFLKYILNKKVIFDFDDNLWSELNHGGSAKTIDSIIRIADAIVVGNQYLANRAMKNSSNVYIVNTVIETRNLSSRDWVSVKPLAPVGICWIGSKAGNDYLLSLEDILLKIKNKFGKNINIYICSDEHPPFKDFKAYCFEKWSKSNERKVLEESHIGLMPLIDSDFARGKCGFKIIQYGAYAVVPIASDLEINKEIIDHGVNGYLVRKDEEWFSCLENLISNKELRSELSQNINSSVREKYSVSSQIKNIVEIINKVAC